MEYYEKEYLNLDLQPPIAFQPLQEFAPATMRIPI